MDRKEAIAVLEAIKQFGISKWIFEKEEIEAFDMAIEALQAEPTKAVPPSLADVYRWERDIALSQLEEYGIGFGEKKRDDLVEVVRCKDCEYRGDPIACPIEGNDLHHISDYDYCSCGGRKE